MQAKIANKSVLRPPPGTRLPADIHGVVPARHTEDDMPDIAESDTEFDPESAAKPALLGNLRVNNSTNHGLRSPSPPPTTCTEHEGESNNSRRHRDLLPLPKPGNDRIELKG